MFRLCLPVILLAVLAACGSVGPSQNKTDTFNGTVTMGAGNFSQPFPFNFNVSKSGEYSVKVTGMTPAIPSSTYFELVYGQAISGGCSAILPNQFALVGATALSGAIYPGNYCVYLVDEGFFTTNEAFTLTVSHP